MRDFGRPFRQLRGKLTLSYMLTTVAAFLVVAMPVVAGVLIFFAVNLPGVSLRNLQQPASELGPYLANPAINPQAYLKTWLPITEAANYAGRDPDPFHPRPVFLAVADTQGRVLGSVGLRPLVPGSSLQSELTATSYTQLVSILAGSKGDSGAVGQDSGNTLVAIAPIAENGHIEGALIIKFVQPDTRIMISWFFILIILSGMLVTVLATFFGAIAGYFSARGLTRRLKTLSSVADRWSRGDFAARALEDSEDEIGQMMRQLNQMAEQLQNLLQTRQKLATLEERNRLARDLHDSVKQQVFAVSMQIGATLALLKRDPAAAEARLKEAQKLVSQAQQELTSLIRELRPAALKGKGLIAALRELAAQWTKQTNIVATLRAEDKQILPLTVEEALFRVAQEGLSNIARHSKATLVQMDLVVTEDTVTLSIVDNGQGFNPMQRDGSGVGLVSMEERMKALGGDVRLESTAGTGTRITARCRRAGTILEAS